MTVISNNKPDFIHGFSSCEVYKNGKDYWSRHLYNPILFDAIIIKFEKKYNDGVRYTLFHLFNTIVCNECIRKVM